MKTQKFDYKEHCKNYGVSTGYSSFELKAIAAGVLFGFILIVLCATGVIKA